MEKTQIGVLVGSARRESFSRKIAQNVMDMLPKDIEAEILQISDLPLYNQDLDDDGTPPESWQRLRRQAGAKNAFLFVTPEYNRSVPPLLKNALDVASRPYGKSAWNGKPGAVLSVSPGAIGGFGANHHLRQSMVFLNIPMLPQPEAYVGGVDKILDSAGKIQNEKTQKFLQGFADAFVQWVKRF